MSPTLSKERARFASPGREYRPVPWWCWTGRLTEPEMQRQLDAMREQAIYEFFIFPIYGMEMPYCSDEYFERVAFTLEQCRRHGMKAWIYDEYTWPSGVCAGFVLRDHPWSRYAALRWEQRRVDGDAEVPYRGVFVAARAIAADGGVMDLPAPAPGAPVAYRGGQATIVVFSTAVAHVRYPYAFGADWLPQEESYLDVLNPAAVGKFIEYTHQRYARRFDEYLPGTLPGFFTDEPCIQEMLPFTGDLFQTFRERCGYDLEPRLHELLVDVGAFRRTRYDYWRLVSERFGEAYHRQIRRWCDEHGVLYTGHLLGEESLCGVLRWSGDIWEASRWMSAPGIDMLANMTGYGGSQPGTIYGDTDPRLFHVTVKLIASTCRHSGAKRMLSEAFGVCTFGLTAAEMRWGANWQAALGVNLFNDNTLQYSIAGFRKWMVSGKHFTTPWFQRYRLFSDYCARLCRMHGEGERAAEVAVVWPRTSTFCLANHRVVGSEGCDHPQWRAMQEAVAAATDALVRWQWDFDLLYEQLVEQAAVEQGALTVGDARYRAVILPAAVALPAAVVRRLGEFARAGGLVVAVESLPAFCPDGDVDPRAELAGACVVGLGSGLAESLDAALGRLGRPLRVAGEKARMIVASQRRYADGDLFFLANMDNDPAAIEVGLADGPACELWDPDSGGIYNANARPEGQGARVALELAPGQGVFLCPRERTDASPWQTHAVAEQALAEEWQFSVSPGNILRLALEARLAPDGSGIPGRHEPEGAEGWLSSRDGLLQVDVTPEETPQYWVRGRVSCSADLPGMRLVVDGADFEAAYLDGARLPGPTPFTLWDHENLAFALPRLSAGDHVITLRARTSKYHSPQIRGSLGWPLRALDPVALLGDFAVEREEPLQAIGPRPPSVRTGDWTAQGYPYFAGIGEYRQTMRAPARQGCSWLDLGDCRDILEVEVNGHPVGTRAWPPYKVEVTRALRPGPNQIVVRVFSTLGNLLWEHYSHAPRTPISSGLLGPCRLVWTE